VDKFAHESVAFAFTFTIAPVSTPAPSPLTQPDSVKVPDNVRFFEPVSAIGGFTDTCPSALPVVRWHFAATVAAAAGTAAKPIAPATSAPAANKAAPVRDPT
jgi:hypothetical protein